MLSVYADGSSNGRSGSPVGWGWVVVRGDQPIFAGYGGALEGTNNTAELMGAIEGLEAVLASGIQEEVELVCDSQYVLGLGSGRYSPTTNLELAARIKALCQQLRVSFRWVKGHVGDEFNERADSLANLGRREYKLKAAQNGL